MESKDFATHPNLPSARPQSAGQAPPPTGALPASTGRVRGWPVWAPYAAVAWSLDYAALGLYWLLSGRGFPYTSPAASGEIGPLIARFGPGLAWVVVLLAGLPAAVMGMVMLRGQRGKDLRPAFILAGALLSATLLLLMTDINLLTTLAYLPFATVKLLSGDAFGRDFFRSTIEGTLLHQVWCLAGGFLWLGATLSYSRRSVVACLACGRREGRTGSWTTPTSAARWGRVALLVALLVPLFYAVTRYAWALGIPLGISTEQLRAGQEAGTWISGLFLANVGLVGAVLMLGLVMRWGEVFPRWLPGLGGQRVPIALAVVPAALMSVLLVVGGLAIWSSYDQMAATAAASGMDMGIVVGPVAVFPVWGVALAVATLAYYYRRRGPCRVCGRGAPAD